MTREPVSAVRAGADAPRPTQAPRHAAPPTDRFESRAGLVVLVAALTAGGVLRLWLALTDDGIYWPDEIFKGLEPAHRLVFGYGLVPWEFVDGAVHWTLPALLAGMLGSLTVVGLTSPGEYVPAARAVLALVALASAFGAYRLARTYGAAELPAACAAALAALAAPTVYFAPRALSENISALPVVFGFALALRRRDGRAAVAVGASLLGLSVLLRLQNGIFAVGLVAVLAARRDWRRLWVALAVLAGWAFAYGLVDRLTWGGWFHSARTYLRFNLVEDGASFFGTEPFAYYFRVLWTSMGPAAILLAVLALAAARRAPGLLLVVIAFLLLHSLTPHKESRFILPALPLLCALAGIGLHALAARLPRIAWRGLAGAVVAAAVLSATTLGSLTAHDIGQHASLDPSASALDFHGDVNRLLMEAHGRPDLCGLKVETTPVAFTGGFTYLHRRVPLYGGHGPDRASRRYNYVIAPRHPGADVVATDGDLALIRLPVDGCADAESYSDRLPA